MGSNHSTVLHAVDIASYEGRYQNNCDMKLSYDKEIQIEMKAGQIETCCCR